jgi:hypothetical protein
MDLVRPAERSQPEWAETRGPLGARLRRDAGLGRAGPLAREIERDRRPQGEGPPQSLPLRSVKRGHS